MNSWTAIVTHSLQHSQLAAVFLDALAKSFVILIASGGVCLCWRRGAASARHLVWFLAVVGLLFLPGLSRLLPAWQRPLWAVGTQADSANELTVTFEFVPAKATAASLHQPPAPPTAAAIHAAGPAQGGGGRRLATHFHTGCSLGPGRLVERSAYHPPLGRGRTPPAPGAPPRRETTLEGGLARVIAPALRGIADWAASDFAAVCGRRDARHLGMVAASHPAPG